MSLEDVPEDALDALACGRIGKDFDRRTHERVVASHFIETERVIHMIMREEDRVAARDLLAQTLLAMIRRAIKQNRSRASIAVDELQHRT